jgi:RHH-type proline utilization regulon transcriptional repressor/proline dehydrogenase/delta 1-pyrroline-5-carboxylate dehydrogenase
MGEALHETLRTREGTRCRIYAPVGEHADLLAYLVRRLLENGANSSFVHQITDRAISARTIAQDPFASGYVPGPLPLPEALFAPERRNARGTDITDPLALAALDAARAPFASPHRWQAGESGPARPVRNPARPAEVVGEVREADATLVAEAVGAAAAAFPDWSGRPAAERAGSLEKAADLYERHAAELLALCAREAGKTLPDAIAEIREAVDFLRYYAARASAAPLPGAARGVIACISPWNFPLAIFTGQVAAALVAGNTVVAKPAEQTPLIAARAVALLHEAGVPESALCLVCGDGPTTGAPLAADPRIAGICFTGSTAVAKRLELQLATSACGPDPMLIAETGGINAMIVDSTALPEQAVRDIVASAFQSAGQRCSALRILYLQREVEEKILTMLQGAMEELRLGDPWAVATDIGPVIDPEARQDLLAYCDRMEKAGRLVARREAPADGLFVPPHIFRVRGIAELEREVFGPVLHVASFAASELDTVIAGINAKGYGLTFGLHTRIDARVEAVVEAVHAGNIYVNRNQIGAVVGSQPFGGEGLSGTGPKAGGPNYLRRFRTTGVAFAATKAGGRASPAAAPLAFPDAAGWARRPDRVAALRKLLRGTAGQALAAAATLDYGPVDLPGPTGEANTLVLAPRGTALCLGPDMDMLLAQVIQALAAGNSVLAVAPDATAGLKPLAGADLPLSVIDTTITPEQAADLDADVVAYGADDETLRAIRQALAGGAGPITRLVAEAIDAVSFCHERVVCVDTTAAGGNATLLATTGEGAP